jgi:hypothetical protein
VHGVNVLLAITAIAAGIVLAPVILIMVVAVAIDTYTFVCEWLEARRSCL